MITRPCANFTFVDSSDYAIASQPYYTYAQYTAIRGNATANQGAGGDDENDPFANNGRRTVTQQEEEAEIKALLENVMQYGEEKPAEMRFPTPELMTIKLLPHQQLGVEWMLKMETGTNKGGILADDMGLGASRSFFEPAFLR